MPTLSYRALLGRHLMKANHGSTGNLFLPAAHLLIYGTLPKVLVRGGDAGTGNDLLIRKLPTPSKIRPSVYGWALQLSDRETWGRVTHAGRVGASLSGIAADRFEETEEEGKDRAENFEAATVAPGQTHRRIAASASWSRLKRRRMDALQETPRSPQEQPLVHTDEESATETTQMDVQTWSPQVKTGGIGVTAQHPSRSLPGHPHSAVLPGKVPAAASAARHEPTKTARSVTEREPDTATLSAFDPLILYAGHLQEERPSITSRRPRCAPDHAIPEITSACTRKRPGKLPPAASTDEDIQ
ncbi:hypothetical protein MRX96_032396 [Rhipicephalus microplus]